MIWQEGEAAERFEEFYEAAVNQGPQTVSRNGVEVAVFVSAEEWNTLKAESKNPKGKMNSQETR